MKEFENTNFEIIKDFRMVLDFCESEEKAQETSNLFSASSQAEGLYTQL